MADVAIYDCTLRDGSQGAGISLSLQDKPDIARRLDAFGVDYVEGGWPGSNPKDSQFFEAIRERPLPHARVSAFGSTRRVGIRAEDDRNLRLLLAAETPVVALVAKSWDFHLAEVLRTSLEENLGMVRDSVRLMKEHGREVLLDAEHFFDGYRANREYALAVLAEAGADWLVLCDTNGAAISPLHLGIRAVVAKSFARIHRQGIAPLGFADPDDYEGVAVGDEWRIDGVRAAVAGGAEALVADAPRGRIRLVLDLSPGEREMLLAGGLLQLIRGGAG